jgi:presenilin-like A22 family membrane protease
MKHNLTVTMFLVAFFILAQVVGLALISKDSNVVMGPGGNITVVHSDTSVGARPDTTGFGSFLYLVIGVAVGTILVLVLMRFKKGNIWKLWFFLAVWIATSISLGVIIKSRIFFDYDVALFIALILAVWKIFRPNIFIHNITEVLMYAGIAVLLVPIFDVFWAVMLLLAISLYDMYAVWKSKHMVKMAKFQTQSNIFAGLLIPYKPGKTSSNIQTNTKNLRLGKSDKKSAADNKTKTAILGGGDVAFPLIFTGVIMESLLLQGLSKGMAFLQSSIIILTTTIALSLLFFYAKKDKFYPAMPFITAGCLIGWVIVMLI